MIEHPDNWLIRLSILVLVPATPVWASGYADVFVFGDSFSDQGNIDAATFGLFPGDPYFDGRFSDGPVWVEYLADEMGLHTVANGANPNIAVGNNYAAGGARVDVDVRVNFFLNIPSLASQLDGYLQAAPPPAGDTLFILFGGNNDVFWAIDAENQFSQEEQNVILDNAAADLAFSVERLSNAGARKILVPNLADLGSTPVSRFVDGNASAARAAAERFNASLAAELDAFDTKPELRVFEMDTFDLGSRLFEDAQNNNGEFYGVTNVDVPIFPGFAGSPGAEPATSMFADDLHVSTVVHALLGSIARRLVTTPCDVNGDNGVDAADMQTVFSAWDSSSLLGDVNLDGIVDAADAGSCFVDWTGDRSVFSVPEPQLLSAVWGVVFVFRLWKRGIDRTTRWGAPSRTS